MSPTRPSQVATDSLSFSKPTSQPLHALASLPGCPSLPRNPCNFRVIQSYLLHKAFPAPPLSFLKVEVACLFFCLPDRLAGPRSWEVGADSPLCRLWHACSWHFLNIGAVVMQQYTEWVTVCALEEGTTTQETRNTVCKKMVSAMEWGRSNKECLKGTSNRMAKAILLR